MQVEYQENTSERGLNAHALSYYTELFCKNGNLSFGDYPYQVVVEPLNENQHCDRIIKFEYSFSPSIDSVEVTKAKVEKSFLKLSFTGKNIYDVVLNLCKFHFSFPFAKNKENVKIQKSSIRENIERLVAQEEMKNSTIQIADHGIMLVLVTQFGECEEILRPENVGDIVVESVQQIAGSDSVSLVVRRAIQRGMALKKIKKEGGCNIFEQIIDEIIQLGTVVIGKNEKKKKETEIFTEYVENFHFVFSNEESFKKVKDFSGKIEEYFTTPLRIEAKWITLQAAGVLVVGGAAAPGLIIIGALEVTAVELACTGSAVALSQGVLNSSLINDHLTESNYRSVLNFIVQEVFKAQQKSLTDAAKAEITDLLDQEDIFSKEKALMKLAPKYRLNSFENCSNGEFMMENKEEIMKRIKAIQIIHRIREIFSQQCFIGVVGLQDAGKRTLIKKIWNVGGKSGYFSHTDVPKLYQITQKVLVVDFPGSNSLDYHAKTFSVVVQ